MRNTFFIALVCLLAFSNRASSQFRYDVQGRPITTVSYTDIEGDPYLADAWISGTVTLDNNKSGDLDLKLDIYDGRLLFKGKNDEAMEFVSKLTGFTLNYTSNEISTVKPLVFINNLPPVDKQTASSWYQLIGDGKVKLVKYYTKQTMESKAFNSATATKSFILSQEYYVLRNGQMTKVSANKKSIVKALDDHAAQVDAYLKTTSINFKSDADLQKLFTWYNTLT